MKLEIKKYAVQNEINFSSWGLTYSEVAPERVEPEKLFVDEVAVTEDFSRPQV